MDREDKIRKNIKYGNSPHDPGTDDQKEEALRRGENPERYKDEKLELSDVIRDAEKGNMGKIRNDIRKIKKWNDDGF